MSDLVRDMLERDDNGYRPGVNGTKVKRVMGVMCQWFYPATDTSHCHWETEYDRKQKAKEKQEE